MDTFPGDGLVGDRVRLRSQVEADAASHIRWRNDAEVAYWACAGDIHFSPVAPSVMERWFADKLHELDPTKDGVFAIELIEGRHIGMADYRDVDSIVRSATVGLTIGEKDCWGHGYGTEALRLLVGFLFDHLNLRRIQLDTWSGNERAMRSFTRVGFREEGRLREAVRAPDGYYDSVIMGLLRAEWVRSTARQPLP